MEPLHYFFLVAGIAAAQVAAAWVLERRQRAQFRAYLKDFLERTTARDEKNAQADK